MKRDDGGPAFPVNEVDPTKGHWEGRYEIVGQHRGMSLRDWFAGNVLAGLMANPDGLGTHAEWAETAYKYADAMLAERSKTA